MPSLSVVPLILLAFAALGGAFVAFLRLRELPIPVPVALAHGALAGGGVFSLYMAIFDGLLGGLAVVSFGLFILAALVGAALFTQHLRGLPIPLKLMALHATLAGSAYVLLVISFFTWSPAGPGIVTS